MSNLINEQLKTLHILYIELANVFVEFCKRHDLMCYLCGGGCIGAVRHQGMIPWDDDLDFFMPRDDYEKAIVLWKEEMNKGRYVLEVTDSIQVYGNIFFTIRDSNTTYIKPYQMGLDIAHGISLDVLPLDGCPKGKIRRKVQCFWALVYSLFCSQIVPTNYGNIVRQISKIILGVVPYKMIRYKIWMFAKKQMTKYGITEYEEITELCSGPRAMRFKYPKKAFEKAIFVPFEHTSMPIPIGYDEYLHIAFGNYMELPPVEKRVCPHDVVFWDLNKSYMNYKEKWEK